VDPSASGRRGQGTPRSGRRCTCRCGPGPHPSGICQLDRQRVNTPTRPGASPSAPRSGTGPSRSISPTPTSGSPDTSHVFDRFYRVDRSRAARAGVAVWADHHAIWSKPTVVGLGISPGTGKGDTFSFTLPLVA
jgi:hypothetical protein